MNRLWLVIFLLLVIGSVGTVFTSSNTVPQTSAGITFVSIGPNEVKPDECAGIAVTNIIVITDGLQSGTLDNDLMVGSATVSALDGGAGNDCLVTGNTAAVLTGGPGDDVCIGRMTTVFHECETEVVRP